jgi:hypothetical protein
MNNVAQAPSSKTAGQDTQLHDEQHVLGAILWAAEETRRRVREGTLSALNLEDFLFPQHRAIFRAMLDLFAEDVLPTLDVVTDRLRMIGLLDKAGQAEYVTALLSAVFTPAQYECSAHRLRIKTARRLVQRVIADLVDGPTLAEPLFLSRLRFASVALTSVWERIADGQPTDDLSHGRYVSFRFPP